jgi:predicted ester cyclase
VSPEENKAIVLRTLEEVFARKNPDAILEADAEDVVLHAAGFPAPVVGRQAVRDWAAEHLAAFESRVTVEDAIAEGDMVALRSTMRLLHKGEYLGIPATGRELAFTQMEMVRLAGGRIQETWVSLDTQGVMQQLGVLPKGRPPRALLGLMIAWQRLGRRGRGAAGEKGNDEPLPAPSPSKGKEAGAGGIRVPALRFVDELFGRRNLGVIREICSPEIVFHLPGYPEPLRGVAAVEEWAAGYLAAFEGRLEVEDVVVEGNLIALRATMRTTHKGEYLGVPPTGRRLTFTELSLTRYDGGRAVEFWLMLDTLGVMQQLGLFPKGQPPRALLRLIVGLQRPGRRRRGENTLR